MWGDLEKNEENNITMEYINPKWLEFLDYKETDEERTGKQRQ